MGTFTDPDPLQETLTLLGDPRHADEVAEADAAIAAGKTATVDEVRCELGLA